MDALGYPVQASGRFSASGRFEVPDALGSRIELLDTFGHLAAFGHLSGQWSTAEKCLPSFKDPRLVFCFDLSARGAIATDLVPGKSRTD